WFNSVFFKMHRHDQISDRTMFVHSTRPAVRPPSRIPLTRGFISAGCLTGLPRQILDEYSFDVPWTDYARDCQLPLHSPRPGLTGLARQILDEYSFDVPWTDYERDCQLMVQCLRQGLPDWAQLDHGLTVELIQPVFYRNKGAYLVGRILSQGEKWPFVLALVH